MGKPNNEKADERTGPTFREQRREAAKMIAESRASLVFSIGPSLEEPVISMVVMKDGVELNQYVGTFLFGMADLSTHFLSVLSALEFSKDVMK